MASEMVMESFCVLSNCPFEMDNDAKVSEAKTGSRVRGPLQTSGGKTIVSFSEFFGFFLFFFLTLVPFFLKSSLVWLLG